MVSSDLQFSFVHDLVIDLINELVYYPIKWVFNGVIFSKVKPLIGILFTNVILNVVLQPLGL